MHVCTLTETSTSCLPALPHDASYYKRFCRRFRKSLLISEKNPRSKFFYRSNSSIQMEKQRHVASGYFYVIHPFSMFRFHWEIFMTIVFVASLSTIPLDMLFVFYTEMEALESQISLLTLDIICIIDIIITCLTGYVNPVTNEVYLEPRRIFWMYFRRGDFVLDIITSMPYQAFQSYFIMHSSEVAKILKLCSIVKALRSRILYKYLQRIFDAWYVNKNMFRLMSFGFYSLICVHWIACIHVIVPLLLEKYEVLSANSWTVKNEILDTAPPTVYVYALYRATALFLCNLHTFMCSFCDHAFPLGIAHTSETTETWEDVLLMVVNYFLGYIMVTLIFVFLLQMILSFNTPSTKYESIMNQLHEYMRHRQLPIVLQQRLVQYYEHVFKKSYFRESAILPLLSDRLQLEITLHCYRTLIENVTILHDLSEDMVSDIVASLKLEVFLPNDIIIKAGTYGDCMYFILSGTVAVSTSTGREVCHLQDGSYFGEIALIRKDQKRIANVVAIENCEMYRLDRKVFKNCIATNLEVYKKLEKLANDRANKTNFLEELHKKHILERTLARKHEFVTY